MDSDGLDIAVRFHGKKRGSISACPAICLECHGLSFYNTSSPLKAARNQPCVVFAPSSLYPFEFWQRSYRVLPP